MSAVSVIEGGFYIAAAIQDSQDGHGMGCDSEGHGHSSLEACDAQVRAQIVPPGPTLWKVGKAETEGFDPALMRL